MIPTWRNVSRPARAEAALIGWLALLSVIYFRPHEFIHGAADAGVYMNMGSHIARSGQLLIDDPLIAQLDSSLYPVFFREQQPGDVTRYNYLAGFYVSDTVPGQIIPQFYALQAVSIAILTAIGGVSWGLLSTPLWGLIGIAAVYFLARGLFGRRAALLTALLLGVVILQNWFARYPTAEVLTQSFVFAGLYALSRVLWQHEPHRGWGPLAGLWLGLVSLIRIDMVLVMGVLVIMLIGLAAAQRWSAGLTAFTTTLGVVTALSVVHAIFFAWPYTVDTFRNAANIVVGRNGPLALGAGVIGLVALIGGARWFDRLAEERRQHWLRRLSGALIALICLAAFYAYFLRPVVESSAIVDYWYGSSQFTSTNRENLVRIGWYVTPVGLLIALLGLCLMLWRERALPVWVFVGVALLSTVVYVTNILNNPHHIYAMRRYVPVVLPALMIWGGYGLAVLSRARWRGAPLLTGLVLVAWLSGMIWQSRVIWRQVDDAGQVAALTQWNQQLTPGAVLLFDDQNPVGLGDFIGTPLRFIFDHPVFALRNPQALTPAVLRALVREWQQQGRAVYVLSEASQDVSVKDVLPLGDAQRLTFATTVLLPTYTDYPNQVAPKQYDLKAQQVQALP
jgi:4-amino-4-deoxy-L-arabinose transferase-like glycosyltransferase